MKKILFTGGGSAGHVVPNLALMHELRYTHRLLYMGTGGIELNLVQDVPFFRVECPKLVRGFSLENFKIPFRLHAAKQTALAVLDKEKPDLVFSKGGYASYPAVWAASKLQIPVLTHESDLSPGLCTRLIAKKCVYVLTSFEETAKKFKNGKFVGSPVRRDVLSGDRTRARRKFNFPEGAKVLLVFGGGSGSKVINEALDAALPALSDWTVFHLAGGNAEQKTASNYLKKSYENDMGSAYAAADVVLCRAGSNTVFELLALKKPAVLVPLAHATRGDQQENAEYFRRQGLVRVLAESELFRLAEEVNAAYNDRALRKKLEESDLSSGTEKIVKIIKEVIG